VRAWVNQNAEKMGLIAALRDNGRHLQMAVP